MSNTASNTLNDYILDDFQNISVVQQYNNTQMEMNGNEWDYVLSYFREVMGTDRAAENFAKQLYKVSMQTKVSVITMVDSMKGRSGLALSMSLAYYLNGIRSPASLLGVNNVPVPNFYASRNVKI